MNSAFPHDSYYDKRIGGNGEPSEGMTLRDYIAIEAMAGLLSSPKPLADQDGIVSQHINAEIVSMAAYGIADAMLAERSKK
jgi:hypothetical protein